MREDIQTVMWKELKTIFNPGDGRARLLLTLLTPILLAVVMPFTWGPEWVHQVPPVALSFLVPVILVGVTVPDSFAGERERHTLETLLASRLPDRAILLGKLGTSVAAAWGLTMVMLLVSLVAVNIAHGEGSLLLYPWEIGLGSLALSLLLAVVAGSAGILISMRSQTAQQASQTLMAIILVPAIILQLVPMVLLSVLPREQISHLIDNANGPAILVILLAVLLVLAVLALALAMQRFRRPRLIAG